MTPAQVQAGMSAQIQQQQLQMPVGARPGVRPTVGMRMGAGMM